MKQSRQILLALVLFSSLINSSCGPDPGLAALQSEIQALKQAQSQSSLSGIVKDSLTNKTLADVRIKMNEEILATDADGFYRREGLSPGKIVLSATKEGYERYEITLSLTAGERVEDILLQPVLPTGETSASSPSTSPEVSPSASPNPSGTPSETTPSSSPTPILLDPSGNPTTAPSANSSPSTSPNPSSSSTPEPSATPVYDPNLDAALQSDLIVTRKSNGLELSFILQKQDGSPVSWAWGDIQVEYFIALANNNGGSLSQGNFLTSGRTKITQSNDPFTVPLSSTQLGSVGSHVYVSYTLNLADERKLERNDPFAVQ